MHAAEKGKEQLHGFQNSEKRLTTLTTKLKSLFISSTTEQSPDIDPTFHHFSLLPNELKVQIWTYAVQAPSKNTKGYTILTAHRIPTTPSPLPSPATIHAIQNQTTTAPFSSATLSPFFSHSDPIPPPNPDTKIFFPIAPLLHTCSLSRHIFQLEWEPQLPDKLRGIISRTGCWVVLMTEVLERQGEGILVLEELEGWAGTRGWPWDDGRLDRRGGRVISYYLFSTK
ncbi:hypothetical protein VTL71DRAFT_6492 [Oculimacula yallundae]|uniref:2EXR domain-containing protein n=1 Tax=Oculimacula yallundae TaxID=86028 RepID=A0ABR4BY96_9HELO